MRTSFLRLPFVTCLRRSSTASSPPLIRIDNATFYRRQPPPPGDPADLTNPPLFPGLTFELPSTLSTSHNDQPTQPHYAIIGPSNAGKSTFLELLRGTHLCFPPSARTYPYLSTSAIAHKDPRLRYAGAAIHYVGFDNRRGLSGMGTYMSARYESRREASDFSVGEYLRGLTQLNAGDRAAAAASARGSEVEGALAEVVRDLRLGALVDMPLSNLSNGQTRRARIAKALLGRPEVLLLDEPFMGLDPPTTVALAGLLGGLAGRSDPRLVLALRPQDRIPEWITHLLFLGADLRITNRGRKEEVAREVGEVARGAEGGDVKDKRAYVDFARSLTEQGLLGEQDGKTIRPGPSPRLHEPPIGEPVIEMDGVVVKYGEKTVLGKGRQITQGKENDKEGLWWTVKRGQRWGVFGPNGSGKTTIISLLTSDHPQSYSLPLRLFSRTRLPSPGKPGIPLFELQRRIGHSSPELHSFFPRHLTVRAALESAFADTPLSRPTTLTAAADDRISAFLRWFQGELNPALGPNKVLAAEATRFGRERLPHSQPGDAKKWREKYNAYWYEYATEREREVEWADRMSVRELSYGGQRVLLFLRAVVAQPDVVVLDEAFSGLDEGVREKCLLFLEEGEGSMLRVKRGRRKAAAEGTRTEDEEDGESDGETVPGKLRQVQGELKPVKRSKRDTRDATFFGLTDEQALIVVSHVKEEVPASVRDWMFLPDASGEDRVRIGRIEERPLRGDREMWETIWGMTGRSGW